MRTEIDRWDPEPVYAHWPTSCAGLIGAGKLVPRQPLPSETYLVQHYGVSTRDGAPRGGRAPRRGLVRTIPQRGSYVAQKPYLVIGVD